MDPDKLRIILLVLGILLIAGIFLWERHKGSSERKSRRAAIIAEHAEDISSTGHLDDIQYDDALSRHLDELAGIVRDGNDDDLPDENVGDESTHPHEPEEILMMSVISRRKYFTGDAIMSAMRSVGLVAGEDNIFYRYSHDEQDRLYAVASMVEPGIFPLEDMRRFTTSGITLFGTLPGPRSGIRIFEDMHETAEKLAAFLDGTMHDGNRDPLDDEALEKMRLIAERYPA
jgi:cell division protein ZipA